MAKFELEGKEYDTDKISDQAKQAFGAVQFTQMEIQRLQAQLAAMQTAHMTYVTGLKKALEGPAPANPMPFTNETLKFNM